MRLGQICSDFSFRNYLKLGKPKGTVRQIRDISFQEGMTLMIIGRLISYAGSCKMQ